MARRPYRIPHAYTNAVKTEIKRLEKIGALKKVSDDESEWAAPLFSIKNQLSPFLY